jgi:SAM-dependent methyltransferase
MSNTDGILERISESRRQFLLERRDILKLDSYLQKEWGIRPFGFADEEWHWQLQKAVGRKSYSAYINLQNDFAAKSNLETKNPERIISEIKFYELIAQQPYLGFVHSVKRTAILDSTALAWNVVKQLPNVSRMLEIGCHAGYHILWLGMQLGLEIHGVDRSAKAIDFATTAAKRLKVKARFDVVDLEGSCEFGEFDFISAVDVLPNTPIELVQSTARFSRSLSDGGVLFIHWFNGWSKWEESYETLVKELRGQELSFGFSDVTGGWCYQSNTYTASPAVFLVKGGNRNFPASFEELERECHLAWKEFADYCNSKRYPREKQTQAFFRTRSK